MAADRGPTRHPVGRIFARDLWAVVPPLVGLLAGLGVLATGRWLAGLLVVGAAVLLAAAERAVLPRRLAGLLIVRGRAFDTVMLAFLGALVVAVALLR